jgi:regulator of PEP synthase PpsR (kinase-PPPase family)
MNKGCRNSIPRVAAQPKRARVGGFVKARSPRVVYVLSDSTGNLARHMLGAFLTQFPPEAVVLRVEPFARTLPRLAQLLDRARLDDAAVCHAMVSQELKRFIEETCRKSALPCRDLTGGIVEFLSQATGLAPCPDLAALHRLDHAYNRRISALEFTLEHDDALGLATLHEADIVLAGVSRTSKTPTSIYLAQQGYRVANVALAMNVEPPVQLLGLPPGKVVGLIINPAQLAMIRARRQAGWGMASTDYNDPGQVAREVAWARRLFTERGWPVLDVTDQAIEETAARVLAAIGEHAQFSTDVPCELN